MEYQVKCSGALDKTVLPEESVKMVEKIHKLGGNAKLKALNFSFDDGVTQDIRMVELGKQFIEMKPEKKQLFYIWGHTYEMDYDSKNWMQFEAFCEMISGHDDIFYGTNTQVIL